MMKKEKPLIGQEKAIHITTFLTDKKYLFRLALAMINKLFSLATQILFWYFKNNGNKKTWDIPRFFYTLTSN